MKDLTKLRDDYGFLLVRCHDRVWQFNGVLRGVWFLSNPRNPIDKITGYAMGCQWCRDEVEYLKARSGVMENSTNQTTQLFDRINHVIL